MRILLAVIIIVSCCSGLIYSQELGNSRLYIPQANSSQIIIDKESKDTTQYFNGDVQAYQDDVFMFCDSAYVRNEILVAFGNVVFVQKDSTEVYADSVVYRPNNKLANFYRNVIIDNQDEKLYTDRLRYDFGREQATFRDTALMIRENTKLQSLTGRYDIANKKAYFYQDVILRDSTLSIRADSMAYDMDMEMLLFLCPTEILQEDKELYCERGNYSIATEEGLFAGNPQYKSNEQKASADTIILKPQADIVELIGKASFQDSVRVATGHRIFIDDNNENTIIEGNGIYQDSTTYVKGEFIKRSASNGIFEVFGNGFIDRDERIIVADSITYNENIDRGTAIGKVQLQDTASKSTIYCDEVQYGNEDELKAISRTDRRPYIMQIMDDDTIYLAADTLYSRKVYEQIDSVQIDTQSVMSAYPKAKIYKSDLQAVCDSLVYNRQDSVFHLFRSPILWSDTTQFKGDTIDIFLKNDEINELQLLQNSFIISEVDIEAYNQIKGRVTNAYFKDGDIDKMKVNGNAESIYYVKDDEEAYIGANQSTSSSILFSFIGDELENIRFFDESVSVMTPIKDINPLTLRLEAFKWLIALKPKDLESIIVK